MRRYYLAGLILLVMLAAAVPALGDAAATVKQAQELFTARQFAQAEATAREALSAEGATTAILTGAADVVILCKLAQAGFDGAKQAAVGLKAQISDTAVQAYLDGQIATIEAKKAAYEQTIAGLEATVAANPGDERGAKAAYQIGMTKAFWGKRQEAITAFQRVVREFGSSDSALAARLGLGSLYEQAGDRSQAETEYQAVVAASPDSPHAAQAVQRIALLYVMAGDSGAAHMRMDEIAQAHPNTETAAAALRAHGDIQLADGNVEAAQELYAQVARDYPETLAGGSARVWKALELLHEVESLSNEKRFDESIAKCQEIIENYPGGRIARQAQEWIGHNYLNRPDQGDWEQNRQRAKAEYTKVIEQSPGTFERARALYYRGVAEMQIGENEAAKADYEAALRESKDDNTLYHATGYYATLLVRMKLYDEARAVCQQMLSHPASARWDNLKPMAYWLMGTAYFREKRYDEAKQAFAALKAEYPESRLAEPFPGSDLAIMEAAMAAEGAAETGGGAK